MTTSLSPSVGNLADIQYTNYLAQIDFRFATNVKDAGVFTTDVSGLWEAFLEALPEHEKPFHQCHSCRRFIQSYGALVTIDDHGKTSSALWNEEDAYGLYAPSIRAMLKLIKSAKVTGVFLTSQSTLGDRLTGEWCHFYLNVPVAKKFKGLTQTPGQAMAEKREDYKNVCVALAEFKPDVVKEALRVIGSDALYRSEKIEGQAKWLDDLHSSRSKTKSHEQKNNLVWSAVAMAPAGFCHPRSSMIGTLLEDIAAGLSFDDVSKKFAAKMHPLQYQRPQAPPSAGTIAQAEKIIDQLKAAGSLDRCFMHPEEVTAIWRPKQAEEKAHVAGGVFSHLSPKGKSKNVTPLDLPSVTMTWDKFSRTILPTVENIELYVPPSGSFTTIVTAVNPDAPPIIQWDSEDERNPASWYLYPNGSPASQYGLRSHTYVNVLAVTSKPCEWGSREYPHQGRGVIFLLEGAKETQESGNALFPEIMKSDFHSIRSVIESYSRGATLQGLEEGNHAIGPMYDNGPWGAKLRVTVDGQSQGYMIDRRD